MSFIALVTLSGCIYRPLFPLEHMKAPAEQAPVRYTPQYRSPQVQLVSLKGQSLRGHGAAAAPVTTRGKKMLPPPALERVPAVERYLRTYSRPGYFNAMLRQREKHIDMVSEVFREHGI